MIMSLYSLTWTSLQSALTSENDNGMLISTLDISVLYAYNELYYQGCGA